MVSSQRTEDSTGAAVSNGVPGTASTLPRPTSRPNGGSNKTTRTTENITYQSSRTVKKTHLPAGVVRKMSLAVLVDQEVTWEKDKNAFKRVLVPPTPEKLKVIRDLVAGITGFSAERGDQLVIETLPFETTLLLEPPVNPNAAVPGKPGTPVTGLPLPEMLNKLDKKTLMIGGGALAGLLLLVAVALVVRRKRRKKQAPPAPSAPATLPAVRQSAFLDGAGRARTGRKPDRIATCRAGRAAGQDGRPGAQLAQTCAGDHQEGRGFCQTPAREDRQGARNVGADSAQLDPR